MDLFDAVRRRLATAARSDDPFPHVIVDRLLPDDAYEELAARWPDQQLFWGDAESGKLDLVPSPPGITPADARAEAYRRMDDQSLAAWNRFVIRINREIVGPFLQRIFAREIAERLAFLQGVADAPGVPSHLKPPHRAQMNVGRFMMRSAGYRLRPHLDALAYLATALYYFPLPTDNPHTEGTTLYHVSGPMAGDEILSRVKTVYFDNAGIAARPAFTAPFVPNTLLAFPNTGRSAHGMTISAAGWRRAFQSHLSLKGDGDHL